MVWCQQGRGSSSKEFRNFWKHDASKIREFGREMISLLNSRNRFLTVASEEEDSQKVLHSDSEHCSTTKPFLKSLQIIARESLVLNRFSIDQRGRSRGFCDRHSKFVQITLWITRQTQNKTTLLYVSSAILLKVVLASWQCDASLVVRTWSSKLVVFQNLLFQTRWADLTFNCGWKSSASSFCLVESHVTPFLRFKSEELCLCACDLYTGDIIEVPATKKMCHRGKT